METASDLTELPTDILLIVTRFLDALDIVHCRSVSRAWRNEFSDGHFLRGILLREYSQAREVRSLLAKERNNHEALCLNVGSSEAPLSWKDVFDKVVARYCALKSGKPRLITRRRLHYLINPWTTGNHVHRHYLVGQWSRYLLPGGDRGISARAALASTRARAKEQQVPIELEETEWTYNAGLLVYYDLGLCAYVLLDIESDTTSMVPFNNLRRVVRRLRLKHNVLIIEWAEARPYHQLNDSEEVHRHFATSFDIFSVQDTFPWLSRWKVTFRNEWKLHYLGFPLTWRDRWVSTHSPTHYAAYIWQPNRSSWGENEPIETFLIWDFTRPSKYRPSQDPTGNSQPSSGPQIVKKLSFLDLDHLSVRQRDTPFLRRIELDENSAYFVEEGCDREQGLHVGHLPTSLQANDYWERVVGIPITGAGPRWEDRYDDKCASLLKAGSLFSKPSNSQPRRATCWRYDDIYPGIRNQLIRDDEADIEIVVVQHIIGHAEVWITSHTSGWTSKLDMQGLPWEWKEIAGDERCIIIQSKQELRILRFDKD